MEEQSEIYDPIFMKLPRLYCNSSMQTKAAIDFSWAGYLPPTGNLFYLHEHQQSMC